MNTEHTNIESIAHLAAMNGVAMTDEEVERIAQLLSEKMTDTHSCRLFSEDEVNTLKSMLKTKKAAAKLILIMRGTMIIWALKDIYDWVIIHIKWGS